MGCGELDGGTRCLGAIHGPEDVIALLRAGAISEAEAEEIIRTGKEADLNFLTCDRVGIEKEAARKLVDKRYEGVPEQLRAAASESRFVAKDRGERMKGTEATAPAKDGLKKK